MNIVSYDKFDINPNVKISDMYIGNNKNKIVKVKNFFKDPEFMRKYALGETYIDEKGQKNLGSSDKQTHWYTHRFSMDCDNYAHFFDAIKSNVYLDTNVQYTFLPNVYNFQYYDRMVENIPHVDPSHYAGVLSLNYNDETEGTKSSTRFHRLKATGEEYTLHHTYRDILPESTPPEGYEIYHKEPHEFNTLILYEARLFHSAYADYSKWTSNIKRLTFNCFYW